MGGVMEQMKAAPAVKVAWLGGTVVAVLSSKTEPLSWLLREGLTPMGDPKFGIGVFTVPVRYEDGPTEMLTVRTMTVEGPPS